MTPNSLMSGNQRLQKGTAAAVEKKVRCTLSPLAAQAETSGTKRSFISL